VRRLSVLGPTLLIVMLSAVAAYGIFSKQATVPSNSFSTVADWVAPTTASSVIAKTTAGSVGYIKQGATYYAYANVADGGNPPDGIQTVTADVSSITIGSTAVPLTSGSYSVGGVSYNYRTASLTANVVLLTNTYTYSITATDSGGRSATTNTWSVVVDNTAPAASDIQTANGGGIAGRADIGDTITYTFSEPIDPNTILSGWTGSSTSVVVRLNDGGGGSDTVTIYNSTNTTQLNLGSVSLGRTDYCSTNRTFGANGTASTMVMSGSAVTVTLGTQSAAASTASGTGTMSWTPSASARDRADNAMPTTAKSETGSADKEF
jgi:hypothetical protein